MIVVCTSASRELPLVLPNLGKHCIAQNTSVMKFARFTKYSQISITDNDVCSKINQDNYDGPWLMFDKAIRISLCDENL